MRNYEYYHFDKILFHAQRRLRRDRKILKYLLPLAKKGETCWIKKEKIFLINPFLPNVPFLYPLKTSENLE